MATSDSSTTYGSISRFNHWIGAALVLVLLGIGLYMGELPRGDARKFWRALHIAIGTVAALFLLWRVLWRVRSRSPLALPQAPAPALQLFSKLVHGLLLAGIAIMALTGPLSIWSAGRPLTIFDWVSIPSPLPRLRALHEALEQVHSFTADVLIALICLHLLGVLKHQFIDRDNILARMTGRANSGL
jgi:cytochrome b561